MNKKNPQKSRHPFRWHILYNVFLLVFTAYVLLKTFMISDVQIASVSAAGIYTSSGSTESTTASSSDTSGTSASSEVSLTSASSTDTGSGAVVTDSSYQDSNISVKITTKRVDDTTVYIADVQVSSIEYLKTAFADNSYGRNIKETTSEIAGEQNAILAINGDYYGFRDYGYVLRNGVLYRSNYGNSDDDAFVIYDDGSCKTVTESETDANSLLADGAVQILSFGPGLIENGTISVSENEEVDRAKTSNPRTAIGMISPLHYVFVVSDGRTEESAGLTLYELADLMNSLGCTEAYNLDGGGSSTMYFNGQVINNPTDGNSTGEREVSDIVYIGS